MGASRAAKSGVGDDGGSAGRGLLVRELAIRLLFRVNQQGAWSNVLIERELSRQRLDGPDRGLFVRLVRGCLEARGTADWALGLFLRRPIAALDPWPREILRLGAYQLLSLDVPDFAVVDTSVALAGRVGAGHTAGLINAVLRRLAAARGELPWPDPAASPLEHIVVRGSHPRWLVERWVDRFGVADTWALCAANNSAPGVTLRANLLRTSRECLLAALTEHGFAVTAARHAPEGIHVHGGGDLEATVDYRDGMFMIQDEASMLAARALAPAPGERIVDACAAPGGKTTHLAELAGDHGDVLAVDVSPMKLAQVSARAARLGLSSVHTAQGDARVLGTVAPGPIDAALVDAPCSGLGVIRRRPELRWRREAHDLPGQAAAQLAILTGVAATIRPGGRLVYSVCSFEPEETDGVVDAFLAQPQGRSWRRAAPPRVLLPHRDGTDGFYYARLDRGLN